MTPLGYKVIILNYGTGLKLLKFPLSSWAPGSCEDAACYAASMEALGGAPHVALFQGVIYHYIPTI